MAGKWKLNITNLDSIFIQEYEKTEKWVEEAKERLAQKQRQHEIECAELRGVIKGNEDFLSTWKNRLLKVKDV